MSSVVPGLIVEAPLVLVTVVSIWLGNRRTRRHVDKVTADLKLQPKDHT